MNVVSIISPKGGVGKTSIASNLAAAFVLPSLQASDDTTLVIRPIYVIELDPQNALQWHFSNADHDAPGICQRANQCARLGDSAIILPNGVTYFPFGSSDEAGRLAFENLIKEEPDWLGTQLEQLALPADALVLIDTPPGPSVYLTQVISCSDIALIPILSDAASYATIPAMETYLEEVIPFNPNLRSCYVLNQVNAADILSTDIQGSVRHQLGSRCAPVQIQEDEAVREALAIQQTVLQYDAHGKASQDFSFLATWLSCELSK